MRTTLAMTFIDNSVKKGANGKPIIKASPVLVNSGQLGNYFNREDQSRIEVATPKNKISLTFNYKYSKWGAMLRFVNFGKATYLDPSINPNDPASWPVNAFTGQKQTLDQQFSGKTVTDLSISYNVCPSLPQLLEPITYLMFTRISRHIAVIKVREGFYTAAGYSKWVLMVLIILEG